MKRIVLTLSLAVAAAVLLANVEAKAMTPSQARAVASAHQVVAHHGPHGPRIHHGPGHMYPRPPIHRPHGRPPVILYGPPAYPPGYLYGPRVVYPGGVVVHGRGWGVSIGF